MKRSGAAVKRANRITDLVSGVCWDKFFCEKFMKRGVAAPKKTTHSSPVLA
jgi:hypothetical protein